jgi:uncharacterized phage protein (TIGR02220 family)
MNVVNINPDYQDDEHGTRQEQAIRVLEFLNIKAGKKFRPNATTLRPIINRLAEGFTVQECKQVIAMKVREWNGVEFQNGLPGRKYLTPETLFRASKFNNYVAEL